MDKKIFFSIKTLLIKNNTFLAVYNLKDGLKLWDLPGRRIAFNLV